MMTRMKSVNLVYIQSIDPIKSLLLMKTIINMIYDFNILLKISKQYRRITIITMNNYSSGYETIRYRVFSLIQMYKLLGGQVLVQIFLWLWSVSRPKSMQKYFKIGSPWSICLKIFDTIRTGLKF